MKRVRRVVLIVASILIATIAAIAIVFCLYYWNINDDKNDFVGTWRVNDTDATIAITPEAIELTDAVAYHYELDTGNKDIAISFGNLEGGGSYRFSLDRNQLAITEGSDAHPTIFDDFFWTVNALIAQVQGNTATLSEGENVTILTRVG